MCLVQINSLTPSYPYLIIMLLMETFQVSTRGIHKRGFHIIIFYCNTIGYNAISIYFRKEASHFESFDSWLLNALPYISLQFSLIVALVAYSVIPFMNPSRSITKRLNKVMFRSVLFYSYSFHPLECITNMKRKNPFNSHCDSLSQV